MKHAVTILDKSVSIDGVVVSSACQVMVRKMGLLRAGVDSSSPAPEFWMSKSVGAMSDYVLMHLQWHYFCGICLSVQKYVERY